MACNRCKTKPVIKLQNSNISLCKTCFFKYFEKKVKKTIRLYKLFKKGDKIGVAISGGKDSLTTLHIINKISQQQKTTKVIAISINEGIENYRDKLIEQAQEFCKKEKIELKTTSYKKEFGKTMDQIQKQINVNACTFCGVFRRFLLNKLSQELKLNVIATGHNLDDEAQSILMNQFRNNITASARLGPKTGIKEEKKFIRRIKPLYFLTEKETMTYAYLKGFVREFVKCPYAEDSFRHDVRTFINEFNKKYPSSKSSIVNSFIEILPMLKEKYKTKELKYCKECKEPCSQETCQKCKLINQIK